MNSRNRWIIIYLYKLILNINEGIVRWMTKLLSAVMSLMSTRLRLNARRILKELVGIEQSGASYIVYHYKLKALFSQQNAWWYSKLILRAQRAIYRYPYHPSWERLHALDAKQFRAKVAHFRDMRAATVSAVSAVAKSATSSSLSERRNYVLSPKR